MEQRTSPNNRAIQARQPADLALQNIAGWLLHTRDDQDQQVEVLIAAAEDAYTRLQTRLVVSLGALGFDALWHRALQLALQQKPGERAFTVPSSLAPGTSGISQLADQDDAPALQAFLHALFTSFFGLLVTFIGEQITFQLVRQLWPALSSDEAGSHTKEHEHE